MQMSAITINLGIIWEIPYTINPCLLPRRPYNECDSAQMALEDTIFSNQIQPEAISDLADYFVRFKKS
jgi:hypothetical protein